MSTPRTSFRQLRRQLRLLAASTEQTEVPSDEANPAFSRRARAVAAALAAVRPVPPAELAEPACLAAIYERAVRGSAAAIGPSLLRRAFAPIAAPRDVAWIEPTVDSEFAAILGKSPPSGPRPLHSWPARPTQPANKLRWVAGVAAAMFVAVGTFVVFRGTPQAPELVFQVSDLPLSHDHCPVFMRDLVDR